MNKKKLEKNKGNSYLFWGPIELGEDYANYTGDQFDDGEIGRNIRCFFEINIL